MEENMTENKCTLVGNLLICNGKIQNGFSAPQVGDEIIINLNEIKAMYACPSPIDGHLETMVTVTRDMSIIVYASINEISAALNAAKDMMPPTTM